jgi:cytochrome b pre-mRNA-processing protein 3
VFDLFRRNPLRGSAELAYRRIVEQARQPGFFVDLGVPDTVDGRFELIALHAFLYLRRLKRDQPDSGPFAQRFFDTMFTDFDRSLREMGTGDLSVGREVKRMAQAFYGRVEAYERGLAEEGAALEAAVARNLFGTASAPSDCLKAMAAYLRREAVHLDAQPAVALLAGEIRFGDPPVLHSAVKAGGEG